MDLLRTPPRFLFFTGKGGVGKTSLACATAVHLADQGRTVLLVSTDPASNVGHVFGVRIGNTVTPIPGVTGLSALEIDPVAAAAAYRERIIGPVRGLLPETELATITESLSGSCTTEIAAFDEFTALLTDRALDDAVDHIVFDTAPTGHTIRLLQLPGSWTDFLATGGDASCLGPLSGLEQHRESYAQAVRTLADAATTELVLVARAQRSSLDEVDRTLRELGEVGFGRARLVVNGVLPERSGDDPLSLAIRARERAAIAAMPPAVAALPRDVVPLRAGAIVGLDEVRALLGPEAPPPEVAPIAIEPHPLGDLVDALEADGHGLVLTMGKGGVGKTTVAAAIAVALARRGHEVHLTTTDPAAHLASTLDGVVDRLTVSRIDPGRAVEEYRAHVMATRGAALDEAGRAALAEDLMSPCTEEVAVFQQFSRVVNESRRRFVVVDTAPTGHTLLLLDATGSYHREVLRQLGDSGMPIVTPLMRLQDPVLTKAVIVTLAETTPVTEAAELQADLLRAGIHPWAWVVNASVAAAAPDSPLLRARAADELGQLDRVRALAPRVAVVPLQAVEPVGEAALLALAGESATV